MTNEDGDVSYNAQERPPLFISVARGRALAFTVLKVQAVACMRLGPLYAACTHILLIVVPAAVDRPILSPRQ